MIGWCKDKAWLIVIELGFTLWQAKSFDSDNYKTEAAVKVRAVTCLDYRGFGLLYLSSGSDRVLKNLVVSLSSLAW